MRPWYRIHRSTLGVLAIVLGWLIFINLPGDRISIISHRFHHGWPYFYFEREGSDRSFWSFAGTAPQFHGEAMLLNALTAFCIVSLVACACELWIRRNGRLLRFGLKSMFAITTAFAVLMGLGIREIHQCHRQNQTLKELAALGNVTTMRHLRKYDWFRSLFGSDFDGTVARVEVVAAQSTQGPLPDLSSLRQVEYLRFENVALTPHDVDQLAGLPKLQYLSVRLSSFRAKDASGLRALTGFPKLHCLHLNGDSFTDEALEHVSRDARIEMISVGSTKITAKGLVALSKSSLLFYLWLDKAAIQSLDHSILSQIPNLHLTVIDNKLTAQDEEALRQLFSNAAVETGSTVDTGEKFIRIRPELPRDEFVDDFLLGR